MGYMSIVHKPTWVPIKAQEHKYSLYDYKVIPPSTKTGLNQYKQIRYIFGDFKQKKMIYILPDMEKNFNKLSIHENLSDHISKDYNKINLILENNASLNHDFKEIEIKLIKIIRNNLHYQEIELKRHYFKGNNKKIIKFEKQKKLKYKLGKGYSF